MEGLQGGLSIIHGPPGTGKSTTIFHIVESRVQPRAQVGMLPAGGGAAGASPGYRAAGDGLRGCRACQEAGCQLSGACTRWLLAFLPPPSKTHAWDAPWGACLPQVLVTCSRNQAVDAVVGKLAGVEGSLLVFGREERLGDKAKQYTLTARLARHPTVAAWLDLMRQLQELRDNTVPPGTLAARVRQAEAVLAAVVAAGASDGVAQEEMRTLRRLLERLRQVRCVWRAPCPAAQRPLGACQQHQTHCTPSQPHPCPVAATHLPTDDVLQLIKCSTRQPNQQRRDPSCTLMHTTLLQRDYSTLAADILQPAITRLLARVLPEVKAAAKREILASTRCVYVWVVCVYALVNTLFT